MNLIKKAKNKLAASSYKDQASLEITYKCNLRCKTCGLAKVAKEKGSQELNTEEWKRIIDELFVLGRRRFTLIGAEPLVRPDVFDLITYIKDNGGHCSITTNALLLGKGDTAERLVRAGLDVMSVSIDGPDESHDDIRGGTDVLAKVKDGIAKIIEARRREATSKPSIRVHTTVSAYNYDKLARMIPLAEDLGTDELQFQYVSETPKEAVTATRYRGDIIGSERFLSLNGSALLSDGQIELYGHNLAKIRSANSKIAVRTGVLSALNEKNLRTGQFPMKTCRIVPGLITIDPYGECVPCAHLDYSFGSVRDESVRTVLNSERYRDFCEAIKGKLFPVCAYCCSHVNNLTIGQLIKMGITGKL
ncbi:MAG: radical SAM protein [Chitinivibrionales bacterium]|nr:radical SAM protein [Chitinivibrionales bacterium]MBD3355791.1 radical SAM protein [Chitinivibrionales bacterium]